MLYESSTILPQAPKHITHSFINILNQTNAHTYKTYHSQLFKYSKSNKCSQDASSAAVTLWSCWECVICSPHRCAQTGALEMNMLGIDKLGEKDFWLGDTQARWFISLHSGFLQMYSVSQQNSKLSAKSTAQCMNTIAQVVISQGMNTIVQVLIPKDLWKMHFWTRICCPDWNPRPSEHKARTLSD